MTKRMRSTAYVLAWCAAVPVIAAAVTATKMAKGVTLTAAAATGGAASVRRALARLTGRTVEEGRHVLDRKVRLSERGTLLGSAAYLGNRSAGAAAIGAAGTGVDKAFGLGLTDEKKRKRDK